MRSWWWALTVLIALPVMAETSAVRGVHLSTANGRTALTVDLSAPTRYRMFTVAEHDRIILDVFSAQLSRSVLPLPAGRGAVRQIRAANRTDGSVRLVLDLAGPVQPRAAFQRASGRDANRIVLDLMTSTPGPVTARAPAPIPEPVIAEPPSAKLSEEGTVSAAELMAAPDGSAPSPPAMTGDGPRVAAAPPRASPPVAARLNTDADIAGGRDIVIAVDPGHGGHDPGARGPSGVREKDVTLRVARALVEVINAEPGMRGMLTRGRDEFLPLRSRMERARAAEADLFVSIHADAVRNRRVRGASVYVLNEKGATDEAARRLAARENAVDLVGGVSLGDKEPVLRSVLLDLSQNASLSSSIEVGEEILAALTRVGVVRKRKVMQAPFMVLKSPDVPSVLIETAYISNPQEERNLANDAWRRKLAGAIFTGLRDYFYSNPPPGTLVAGLSRQRLAGSVQHVIRRGETLSGIAGRYNVSVSTIRAANRLRGDRVNVGQVLRIPRTHET